MDQAIQIDVIILSFAKNERLRQVTEVALKTLLDSEPVHKIRFNVVVLESNKETQPYSYPQVRTEFPQTKFGYHKYMNIGIEMGTSPYVCICNNDLVFHPGWASAIMDAFGEDPTLNSASPACSIHHPQQGISLNGEVLYGYEVRRELVGWCLFFKREMLKVTGRLDPRFKFWYADNDYSMMLQKHGFKHALVTDSIVDHLESQTLNTEDQSKRKKLTARERFYFEYKWKGRSLLSYLNGLRKYM
jgi:GT2 family glycosyltransferase